MSKNDYAIHILSISLWEWENIKERSHKNIARDGLYQEAYEALHEADEKIPQLKEAIELLKQDNLSLTIQ